MGGGDFMVGLEELFLGHGLGVHGYTLRVQVASYKSAFLAALLQDFCRNYQVLSMMMFVL